MAQTVYDVGDPITSRLKLGVTPDGSTIVTIAVTRPDGTAIAAPTISDWVNVDEKTAQFYATDDGTSGGGLDDADGDWLVVWKVEGTGANVAPKVYPVSPLPGTSTRAAWSPFLSDVADHIPYLTVDTVTPGSQVYLGTFTGVTTPTDEVAQRHVDGAVSTIGPLLPGLSTHLYPAARAVAALRTAASLARAYPRRPEDLAAAAALDARATEAWKALLTAYGNETANPPTNSGMPVYYFPSPVAWGDTNL